MKRILYVQISLLFKILIISSNVSAQSLPEGIFKNEVYQNVRVISDVIYGSNYNFYMNETTELTLDIYQPDVSVCYRRPLLIYCHGGAFTTGDKSSHFGTSFGDYFAKRGYVVASINYRLGSQKTGVVDDNYEIMYQAVQDAKAAIRFFKKYHNDYCLDTSTFFLSGTSAGATLTLLVAYWDQNEANPFVDEIKLGLINAGGGSEGYSNNIKAVVSCWGGINDTAWLKKENLPNILFHGTEDPTIPYIWGYNNDGQRQFGSFLIHEASVRYKIESELHPFVGEGHGVSPVTPEFDTLLTEMNAFLFDLIPENMQVIYYLDKDGDGFGAPGTDKAVCVPPDGYVDNNNDCNDDPVQAGALIFPEAIDICGNGLDENCNGTTDENCCTTPATLTTSNITTTAARLKWTSVPVAAKYKLQYKKATDDTWIKVTINAPDTTYKLTGLSPSTKYKWKVKAICPDSSSAFSSVVKFTTAVVNLDNQMEPQYRLFIYPNPANRDFIISLEMDEDINMPAHITIVNAAGQCVYTTESEIRNGTMVETYSGNTLLPGKYFVRMIAGDEAFFTSLIVNRE